MTGTRDTTVVVVATRGDDEVARCVDAVMRHAEGSVPFELVVVDDGSRGGGIVRGVNQAVRRGQGDVVLLDAATLVTHGWLDRLAAGASRSDVATVTPLSNAGSICTVPRSVIDAFDLEGVSPAFDECAVFIATHSLRLLPEVITGVGFCMYVTRSALDRCGLFDESTFDLVDGAVIDHCLRATRLGLRHLVEDATFVYRPGPVLVDELEREGLVRASAALHDRHGYFSAANRRARSADPFRVPLAAFELALDERSGDRPHVLHLLHGPPGEMGGTEMHLRALLDALHDDFDFSILFPVESGFLLRTYWQRGDGNPIEREFLLPGAARRVTRVHDANAAEALRTALDMFEFDAVHIQNLIGHSLAPMQVLASFPGPVVCSVHDLYLACPNHSLLYRNQWACGIPDDLELCERCLPETRQIPFTYLEQFRSTVSASLDTVDHWVFASESAADYFRRLYEIDPTATELIPHGSTIDLNRPRPEIDPARILDEPLRLAFVGRGWSKKGLAVVNALADSLADSSVEIHHFGEQKDPSSPELYVHGAYDHELLPELLHRAGIQIVLLPGPYAETFGFVMTEALVAGIPVIGAGYGALGERIRAHGAGWTVDPRDTAAILSLIESLDGCRSEVLRAARRARSVVLWSVADDAARYAALYSSEPDGVAPTGRTPNRVGERR